MVFPVVRGFDNDHWEKALQVASGAFFAA